MARAISYTSYRDDLLRDFASSVEELASNIVIYRVVEWILMIIIIMTVIRLYNRYSVVTPSVIPRATGVIRGICGSSNSIIGTNRHFQSAHATQKYRFFDNYCNGFSVGWQSNVFEINSR